MSSSKSSNRKRPQTGSLNARIPPASNKESKLDVMTQPPIPKGNEKRSHSGTNNQRSSSNKFQQTS